MSLDPELDSYLRQAWERNEALYEPPAPGKPFRSPLFDFVRTAKAHPSLGKMDGFSATLIVERHLKAWNGSDGDEWATSFPNSADPKAEFLDTWDKVRWAQNVFEQAVQDATSRPLIPARCVSAGYARFISIAGHLQRLVEGRPILLPCRKVADYMDCDPTTISRYRNLAVKAGLLEMQQRGRKVHREADELRFRTEKFDWENGRQIDSENLRICVASTESACYTDSNDIERKKETHELQESQDSKEKQDSKDSPVGVKPTFISGKRPNTMPKFTATPRLQIPTTAELAEQLQTTAHLLSIA